MRLSFTTTFLAATCLAFTAATDGSLRGTTESATEVFKRKLAETGMTDTDIAMMLSELQERGGDDLRGLDMAPTEKAVATTGGEGKTETSQTEEQTEEGGETETSSTVKPVEKESETPKSSIPKSNPRSDGDPHFTMFNGHKFDFHGGCDLVLVENPDFNNGQGLTIHIRTVIKTWWSYIESAVVKIGDDTFEVHSGIEDKSYWVNGEAGEKMVDSGNLPIDVGGFPVRFRVRRENEFQFKIFLDDTMKQAILIRSVKDFLRVEIENPSDDTFVGTTGLMGGPSHTEMFGRDGMTVITDPIDYGMEWQVSSSEPMLFHSADGAQAPEMCTMPTNDQAAAQRRRLVEGPVSRTAAMKACAHVGKDERDDCVFDVLATGDLDLAGGY